MLYILFTTGACNLRCSYCGGSIPERLVPWTVKYRLEDLVNFVKRDPDPIVAFYGGEPLLNPEFIKGVMDSLEAKYVIQTNGTLVKRLPLEYWRKFDAVLLSIDGRREVNDLYRGEGNYDLVLEAARWLKENGFRGDLIARMVMWHASDVYSDVKHLLDLGLFDHVHWQLNVVWTEKWDFEGWAERSYLPGIRKLVDMWVREMGNSKVLGIVPFLGIMKVELFDEWRAPPCGAGVESVSVLPDGRIVACPIAFDVKWSLMGNLKNGIKRQVRIGEPCSSCPYFKYCGGRCLYAYKERLWGDEGFRSICDVTKKTIDYVLSAKEEILRLIEEGVVSKDDFYYPPFDNTTEIIP